MFPPPLQYKRTRVAGFILIFSRLTITDSAGLSDSTTAAVKVIQPVENDQMPYPSHVTLAPTSSPGLAATLAHRQGDPTTATSSVSTAATQMTGK